jgi:hypothetical protein
MKTITFIFCLLASVISANANTTFATSDIIKSEGPEMAIAKSAMEREVARHLYFPIGQMKLTGEAEVMLRVLPEGKVEVLLMNSTNNELKEFITRQVNKFRLTKDEIKQGEVYRYKLCFKRQA